MAHPISVFQTVVNRHRRLHILTILTELMFVLGSASHYSKLDIRRVQSDRIPHGRAFPYIKWSENKLQLNLLPNLDQLGCILVSNHILWDILPGIRVRSAIMQTK